MHKAPAERRMKFSRKGIVFLESVSEKPSGATREYDGRVVPARKFGLFFFGQKHGAGMAFPGLYMWKGLSPERCCPVA